MITFMIIINDNQPSANPANELPRPLLESYLL